jgi:hypothetical protein
MANNTAGEKELKTNWPVEEGLVAGTTKQTGRKMYLIATEGSLVSQKDKIGIDY